MNTSRRSIRLPATTAFAVLGLAALALASAAQPASAQSNRAAISVLGGGSAHGNLAPTFMDPAVLNEGWIAGLQTEAWLGGGRTGVRLNTLYTQRTLETGPGDYNVWSADIDFLARVLPVREDRSVAPYLAFGAGATHYAGVAGSPPIASGAFGGHPVIRAHVLAAVGMDALSSRRGGLRFEVADRIVLPSIGESPQRTLFPLPMVHNLVATAGVQLRMGSLRETVVIARAERPVAEARVTETRVAETAQAAPAEPAPEAALFTVQVASFVEAPTAGRWAERLRHRGIPVWLIETVVQGERVSRVRVGALESESEAHSLAAALERDGWRVWVDAIAANEPYPDDAVSRTRDFLYGN